MTEPSKVLHIRNVGAEIAENDLLQLVERFGTVTRLVMLRAKNQALMQMDNISSAINVIDHCNAVQPSIRGRNVYIQFSSHQELTNADQSGQVRRNGDQDSQPNRILLVTIQHVLYPITVDVLHQVFSPYGFVEKIVIFQKSGMQAFIQYSSRQDANQASNALQGRNIYDGCCQLDIQFSNLSELQVNYNGERTRDFTNNSLPSEPKHRAPNQSFGEPGGMYGLPPVSMHHMVGAPPMGLNSLQMHVPNASAIMEAFGGVLPRGVTGNNDRCTILAANLNPEKIDEDKLFNLFSIYGNIVRIKLLRNKPDHALVQMADGFQAELAVNFLKGAYLFGRRLEVNFSKHAQIHPSPDSVDFAGSKLNRFNRNMAKNYRYCCSPTKMIHVSSLPADMTEEEIVSHLEEHGSIVSSRIFEANGKKQALILFENEEQATEALVCKHALVIDGLTIRLSFSQLQSISAT